MTKCAIETNRMQIIANFHSSVLGNERDLYVYLPPSYHEDTQRHYPVLYMHDGQNIFHPASMSGNTWNVHTTLETLIETGKVEEAIVVGVACIDEVRMEEYMHDLPPGYSETSPRGKLYEQFFIEEVMPFINGTFRTAMGPANTALMGSSAGGTITFNMGFRRPDIFGKLGVVSPALFLPDLTSGEPYQLFVPKNTWEKGQAKKLWIDIGQMEGILVPNQSRKLVHELIEFGYVYGENLVYYHHPSAAHSELDWAERMEAVLLYFFGMNRTTAMTVPEQVELHSRSQIGLNETAWYVNSIVHFDSGLVMSGVNQGTYSVENPDILDVSADGKLTPLSAGTTAIRYSYESLHVEQVVNVIPHVDDEVSIEFKVDVPTETPRDQPVFVGMSLYKVVEMERVGPTCYKTTVQVPRDMGLDTWVRLGTHHRVALDVNRERISNMSILADENKRIHIRVSSWA